MSKATIIVIGAGKTAYEVAAKLQNMLPEDEIVVVSGENTVVEVVERLQKRGILPEKQVITTRLNEFHTSRHPSYESVIESAKKDPLI